jgi:hypothetical protein
VEVLAVRGSRTPSGVATYAGRPAMVTNHTVTRDVETERLDIALQHLVADAR